MRVITTKASLVESLGFVSRAVSSRSSIQILSGVLLEAGEDSVSVSATDMEISIKAPLQSRVERPGAVVVPARILADIARTLPIGDVIIEQRPGETVVELRAGESLFVLHSQPAPDFPQLPKFPSDAAFTVGRAAFVETIERVASSASRDETRPVLTGVLISFARNTIRMVATDSYRLSVKETHVESSGGDKLQIIIPARALLELSRVSAGVGGDEALTVIPTENQVMFQVGGVTLVSRLIDGQFPNHKQLLPETFDYQVAVDREELLDVVRRVKLLAQKNTPLRLHFLSNTLTVAAESQDIGKAKESLPIQYSGDDLEIGFNPDFLEDGIEAVKESPVYLRFISPLRPGLIQGAGDDFTYLVMPIRLSE